MRQSAGISFTLTGHSALLRLANRFASEKLPSTTNQVAPFYMVKTDTLKIVAFKRGGFEKIRICWQT
jgi:hypothetical protein